MNVQLTSKAERSDDGSIIITIELPAEMMTFELEDPKEKKRRELQAELDALDSDDPGRSTPAKKKAKRKRAKKKTATPPAEPPPTKFVVEPPPTPAPGTPGSFVGGQDGRHYLLE